MSFSNWERNIDYIHLKYEFPPPKSIYETERSIDGKKK